jgi:hypothetical protein
MGNTSQIGAAERYGNVFQYKPVKITQKNLICILSLIQKIKLWSINDSSIFFFLHFLLKESNVFHTKWWFPMYEIFSYKPNIVVSRTRHDKTCLLFLGIVIEMMQFTSTTFQSYDNQFNHRMKCPQETH